MRARVVIGANFGDEGKGLITDYLCATQGAGMVVRFNGGANAGHTVVDPSGRRHVFSHFGSGSLAGVPTYFSRFCVLNPILFFEEGRKLSKLMSGSYAIPQVYAHPDCQITTFADMLIGQKRETSARHGSTGVGVNETCRRSAIPELKITMADLWNGNMGGLQDKLEQICGRYAEWRCGEKIEVEHGIQHFLKACESFAECVLPMGMADVKDPVFEGAQGLLLSEDRKEFFPHVTPSYTGMRNVRALIQDHGKIEKVDAYYVSRTYLTRHGNGPLPGHEPGLRYADDTNQPNEWQGTLRFAPLDVYGLAQRCREDLGTSGVLHLALTHVDQHQPASMARGTALRPSLVSDGPTRENVENVRGDSHGIVRTK